MIPATREQFAVLTALLEEIYNGEYAGTLTVEDVMAEIDDTLCFMEMAVEDRDQDLTLLENAAELAGAVNRLFHVLATRIDSTAVALLISTLQEGVRK